MNRLMTLLDIAIRLNYAYLFDLRMGHHNEQSISDITEVPSPGSIEFAQLTQFPIQTKRANKKSCHVCTYNIHLLQLKIEVSEGGGGRGNTNDCTSIID